MEIEILTTKKKLSKNIIKQLDPATVNDMAYFNSMPTFGYYIRDLGAKYPPVVLLFEGLNGWKIVGCRSWRAVEYRPCVEAPASEIGCRGTSVRTMESSEYRDNWLREYNNLKESCLKNHLII